MKRVSLIIVLALLLSTIGYSAVFAQSTTPNNGSSNGSSSTRQVNSTSAANPCGYGDLEGNVKNGKLYAGPTFSLRQWLKHNPRVTMDQLNKANLGQRNSGLNTTNSCSIIILPSM